MTTQLGGYEDNQAIKNSSHREVTVTQDGSKARLDVFSKLVDGSGNVVKNYTTIISDAGLTTYFGYAEIGSTTSSAVWRIKSITTLGTTDTIGWADGVDSFTKTWDDRASYTYS